MPKIKITEIDNTGIASPSAIPNIVYVPGLSAKLDLNETLLEVEPKLFTNVSDFKNSTDYNKSKLSYKLAKHLLELGLYVLYEGILEDEGVPIIDWNRLSDKGLYDIRFLTTGEYEAQEGMVICASSRGDCVALLDHPKILTNGYELIESEPIDWESAWNNKYKNNVYTKSDAYNSITKYIPFVPGLYYKHEDEEYVVLDEQPDDWVRVGFPSGKYYSKKEVYVVVTDNNAPTFEEETYYLPTSKQVALVREYFGTIVGSSAGSYSAAFTPWFKTKSPSLLMDGEEETDIPASFGYLFAYANSVVNNPEWYAVAGSYRGIIGELTGVCYSYTSAEVEMLQGRSATHEVGLDKEGDNVGFAVNPIAYVRPFGYIVWGNRTMLVNNGDTKATSFLNVRNLVSIVKKSLYNSARKYTFEQNSDILWGNFKSQITPILDQMQTGNGILGYKFTKLVTPAKARLKARLTIIPIEAVEDFELEIELTNADAISTVENV